MASTSAFAQDQDQKESEERGNTGKHSGILSTVRVSGTGMPCKTTSVLRLSQMVHQPSVDFIIYNNNLLLIIYYYYHYRYYHYYHYASHIDNSHCNLGFTSCGSRHLCIWHKCTLLLIPEGTQREGKHSKLQLRGNFPWLEAIIHSNKLL